MEQRNHRRPLWQPGPLSRLSAFLDTAVRDITPFRLTLAIFVLPLLFYIYREVTRDVLIVDPFTVPKNFQEAGLTPDVMAIRIGDLLSQMEKTTATSMKKDELASAAEEDPISEVEIPGAS